jgi:hypothetical protein
VSAIQVSRLVRLGVEARFAAMFNTLVAAACVEFGIPTLAYGINFAEDPNLPANFFRGDRTLDSLGLHQEPDLPVLITWTGEGANLKLEMPRMFSGRVTCYWRFLLFIQGIRRKGLVDLREATEAAMVGTLAPEFTAVGYMGDLAWQPLQEQQILDQDQKHFGWVQEVTYSAGFEVNV